MDLLKIVLIVSVIFISSSSVGAGSIQGEVKFTGALPKPNQIKVTKDQDYCGKSIPDETYLVGSAGGLKNVVVFLDKAPAAPPPLPKEHILENSGCRFVPRILCVRRRDKGVFYEGKAIHTTCVRVHAGK